MIAACSGAACSVFRRKLGVAALESVTPDYGLRFIGSFSACGDGQSLFRHSCQRHFPQGARRCIYIPLERSSELKKTKSQARKDKKARGGRPSYRFVDRTRVRVVGGSGGMGSLSVHHIGRKHHRRPDGGHGGRGGDVIIVADPNEQTLRLRHPHVTADSGKHGSSQQKHGRNGRNRIMRVPCGVVVRRILNYDEMWDPDNQTVVKIDNGSETEYPVLDDHGEEHSQDMSSSSDSDREDDVVTHEGDSVSRINLESIGAHVFENEAEDEATKGFWNETVPLDLTQEERTVLNANTGEQDELVSSSFELPPSSERESIVLADLDKPGAHVLVARGGQGGRGNCSFASRSGPTPDANTLIKRAKPEEGEVAFLEMELKLIADIGLVGFPNAGKSSLLAAMSRAKPAIEPYPFTTLHPLLGCIEYRDGFRVFAADVPGLVGGASQGRGRGHDFLRHLERTKALLYIVDAAGVDGRDPIIDLQTLTEELSSYGDGDMLKRPALVVANKLDLLDQSEQDFLLRQLQLAAEEAGIRFDGNVQGISAGVTGYGLGPLSLAMRNVVIRSEEERVADEDEFEVSH